MHNFDRGLIKWLPFDALTGFKKAITELKRKRLKKEKPILSEDQNEVLNNKLGVVSKFNLVCEIYYYKEGYIEFVVGEIKKVDQVKKQILINGIKIKISNILEINYQNTKYEYESFYYD